MLVGIFEEKPPLWIPGHRWDDNIKMSLKEGVDCIINVTRIELL
jgi:hypothetical protein